MSYPRKMIGNRGMTPYPRAVTYAPPHAAPQMYAPGQQQVFTRSLTPAAGMGAGNPFGDFGEFGGNPLALQPAAGQEGGGLLSSMFGGGGGATGTAGGGGFNVEQIKAVIDKLGGVEGIVETFNKMQKMVQSVQQFAPMIKLLFNSFGKKDSAAPKSGGNRSGRRRRRRRGTAQGRRRSHK
ncbi:hypothetical protein NLX71_15190 [Paenibacillus sp. MZ04-78.2]|uniref:hypothetical protein n=1 Tax=Paenibacillus sp. MZ04-78.2 TaxID=2962034 RepID=UPI0020B64B00|nr:hypothetical protein [Paenibacillus sp. MZ04-78.2]MCP3774636.1 hypothetical protein [Paenibacillus sp. MZ04-78.2]